MRTRPFAQNTLGRGISPSLWVAVYICPLVLSQAGGLHVEEIAKTGRSVAPCSVFRISRITDENTSECGRAFRQKNFLEDTVNSSYDSQVEFPESVAQWPTKSGKENRPPAENRRQWKGNGRKGDTDIGYKNLIAPKYRILHSTPMREGEESGFCAKASASTSRSQKDISYGNTATSLKKLTTDREHSRFHTFLLWLWSKVMVTFQSLLRTEDSHEAARISSISCGKSPFEPDRRDWTTLQIFQRKHSKEIPDLKYKIDEQEYKPDWRLSRTNPLGVTQKSSYLAAPQGTETKHLSCDNEITKAPSLKFHELKRQKIDGNFDSRMGPFHQSVGQKESGAPRQVNGADAAVKNLDREIYFEIKSNEPFKSYNSWTVSQLKYTSRSKLNKMTINSRKSMSSKTFKFLEILRKSDLSNLDGYEALRLECIQAFGTGVANTVTHRPRKIWRGSERQKIYDLNISRLLQSVLRERKLSERQLTIAWKLKNRMQPMVFTYEEWEGIKTGIQMWKAFSERQSDQLLAIEFLKISNEIGFLPDKSNLRILLWKLKYHQSLSNIEQLKTNAMVLCYKKNILSTNTFFENALWYVMKTPQKFLIDCSQRQIDTIKHKLERFAFTADEKYTIMEALELQSYPHRHSWTLAQMDIQNRKYPGNKLALSPIYKTYQEALKDPETLRLPQTHREQGVTMSLLISKYDNLEFPNEPKTVKGHDPDTQRRNPIKVDSRDKYLAKSLIQAVGIPTSYIETYHLFLNLSLKDILCLKQIHLEILKASTPDYDNMINMISKIMEKAKKKINGALSLGT
ncbi:hypothetical protein DFH28DRAFT_1006629 [Melampsora americana]|nr:hypothetical protein DFH28DRAFT_1006629 [Melampsora americana]